MPRGSMKQFFNDRGGPDTEHGAPLSWPGTPQGYPVRGRTGLLKKHELENVPLSLRFRSRAFRLWEEPDQIAFNDVMNRVVVGWYYVHKRFDQWIPEAQGYYVWLEWVQVYGEVPDEYIARSHDSPYAAGPEVA